MSNTPTPSSIPDSSSFSAHRTDEEADRIRKEAAVLFAELFYRQVMEARREKAKRKDEEDRKLTDKEKPV